MRPPPRVFSARRREREVASDLTTRSNRSPSMPFPSPKVRARSPCAGPVLDWLPHRQHRHQPHPLVARTDRGRSGSGGDRSMLQKRGGLPQPPAVYTKDEPEGIPDDHRYARLSRPGRSTPTRRPGGRPISRIAIEKPDRKRCTRDTRFNSETSPRPTLVVAVEVPKRRQSRR
jgi:hypothetical protein